MPGPHIVLSGYYGFQNAGDEAILQAIVEDLRRLEPQVRISVLTADPPGALRLGLEPVGRNQPGPVMRALRRADLLISGGGGLIQDSTGVNSVIYYLGVCLLARLLGRRVMFYCQGFGPVTTVLGQRLTGWLANHITVITLRDEDSAREMRSLGVTRPALRVTADPVLGLQPCESARVRQILSQEGLTQDIARLERPAGGASDVGPLLAVAVRPWPGLDLEELAGGLRRFAEEDRARLLLIPFQPSRDRPLSQELAQRLAPHARVLEQDYEPRDLMGLISCMDMVLGMRLHALIMAAARHIPCLGLSYDPKVERFCQRCGALSISLPDLRGQALFQALHHLLQGRAHARAELQSRVAPMVESVRGTARCALALAKGLPLEQALSELH